MHNVVYIIGTITNIFTYLFCPIYLSFLRTQNITYLSAVLSKNSTYFTYLDTVLGVFKYNGSDLSSRMLMQMKTVANRLNRKMRCVVYYT